MAIIKAKPTSPGRRFRVQISSDLHKGRPEKKLVESKSKISGRNNNGRITVRHQGGGHKRLYRIVDFKRNKFLPASCLRKTVTKSTQGPLRTKVGSLHFFSLR